MGNPMDEEKMNKFISDLSLANPYSLRADAASALIDFKSPKAIDALIKTLQTDTDPLVCAQALIAISFLVRYTPKISEEQKSSAFDAAKEILAHGKDEYVRAEAASALWDISPKGAIKEFEKYVGELATRTHSTLKENIIASLMSAPDNPRLDSKAKEDAKALRYAFSPELKSTRQNAEQDTTKPAKKNLQMR